MHTTSPTTTQSVSIILNINLILNEFIIGENAIFNLAVPAGILQFPFYDMGLE